MDPVAQGPSSTEGQPQGTTEAPAQEPSWRDSLPEDLKAEKSLSDVKDIPSLAKNYVEAQKYIGGSIRIPTDTSKPQEWDAVYSKLGRPEKPEGYKIERPKTDLQWDEGAEKEARALFHKIGLNSNQAQALINHHSEMIQKMVDGAKTSIEQGVADLRKQHGEKFDQVVLDCNQMVKQFCTPEEIEMIESTGRGNEPWFVNMMARAWGERGEDKDHRGTTEVSEESRNEALAKIAQIRKDASHPYHKGNKDAVAEMDALYRKAYSSQVVAETSVLPEG